MKPDLYIVKDSDWPAFSRHETNAKYERYGIVPGEFYDDDVDMVFMSESTWRSTMEQAATDTGKPWHEMGEGLTEHELLHPWIPFDHRTSLKGGFLDALKCGFDTRAFTRLLRWRWNRDHHARSRQWIQGHALAWKAGVLTVKGAPT